MGSLKKGFVNRDSQSLKIYMDLSSRSHWSIPVQVWSPTKEMDIVQEPT